MAYEFDFKMREEIGEQYTMDPADEILGGVIDPYDFLEEEDAERVSDAIELVREFWDALIINDLLEVD